MHILFYFAGSIVGYGYFQKQISKRNICLVLTSQNKNSTINEKKTSRKYKYVN